MPKHLTVQDKIVVHLASYMRYAEEFECPEDMSQAGISRAIGKSRAHTTLELKALKEGDVVSERVSHVKGAKSKKKVYNLTAKGIQLVKNLRGIVDNTHVEMEVGGKITERGGRGAVEELMARDGISELDASLLVLGAEGPIRVGASHDKSLDVSGSGGLPEGLPEIRYFFGRDKELDAVEKFIDGKERLLSVTGMPGIGKTTLASKIGTSAGGSFRVFYIRLYAFDSPISFIQQFSRFAAGIGKRGLSEYLANKPLPDVRESGFLMGEMMAGEKFMIIVDDLDAVGGEMDGLIRMIYELAGKHGGSKLIVMSSRLPGFYDRKDVEIDSGILEMELGGLDDRAAMLLLERAGKTEAGDRKEILKRVGGHPLALELASTSEGGFEDYIYENVLSDEPDALDLLSLCSVLRAPFNPWDMRAFGYQKAMYLFKNAYFTKYDGGRICLHGAVAKTILDKIGERGLRIAHERAAHYCREFDEEPSEILYHLIEAGQVEGASEQALEIRDCLLSNISLETGLAMIIKLSGMTGGENLEILDMAAEAMNLKGLWEEALAASKTIAERSGGELRTKALLRIAKIENKMGRASRALEVMGKLDAGGGVVNGGLEADIALTRGIILHGTGNYPEALKELDRSIESVEKASGNPGYLRALMERGAVNIMVGKFDLAGKDLTGALEEAEAENSRMDIARIKINLALLNMRCGKLEEAAKGLEGALTMGRELCQPRIVGYGLIGLAECHNRMKDAEVSLAFSEEALSIFDGLGAATQISAVHSNIGTSMALMGNPDKAIENFERSVEIMEGIESPFALGQRYLEYGRGKIILGDPYAARIVLEEALAIFQEIGAEVDSSIAAGLINELEN